MKTVVAALTVLFVAAAAHAQMPQQWKSPATGESERSMLNCAVQHPDSWNNICGKRRRCSWATVRWKVIPRSHARGRCRKVLSLSRGDRGGAGSGGRLGRGRPSAGALQTEVASLIEKDVQDAEGIAPCPPIVYHYTDVMGALGILQSGRLWFTERAHMNDPVEIRYGLDTAHKLFQTVANNRSAAVPKDIASHLRGEFNLGLAIYGFWIASFSRDGNDLGQWRSYADEGRGVCLGFSTQKLDMNKLAKPVPGDPTRMRFSVDYNKDSLVNGCKPMLIAVLI